MLPNPVDSFSSLITEISGVEVPAEKENERGAAAIGASKLRNFCRLLLSPLVNVCEIPRRLRLKQQRVVSVITRDEPQVDRIDLAALLSAALGS